MVSASIAVVSVALTRYGNQKVIKQNPLQEEHFSFERVPLTCLQVGYRDDLLAAASTSSHNLLGGTMITLADLRSSSSRSFSITPRVAGLVATGDSLGNVIVWNTYGLKRHAKMKEIEKLHQYRHVFHDLHTEQVCALAFSRHLARLYTASSDRTLCALDLSANVLLHRINTQYLAVELCIYDFSEQLSSASTFDPECDDSEHGDLLLVLGRLFGSLKTYIYRV